MNYGQKRLLILTDEEYLRFSCLRNRNSRVFREMNLQDVIRSESEKHSEHRRLRLEAMEKINMNNRRERASQVFWHSWESEMEDFRRAYGYNGPMTKLILGHPLLSYVDGLSHRWCLIMAVSRIR